MAIKKALKRIVVSVFVVFGLVLNSATVYALDNPFKLTKFEISDKAAGVEGTAGLNSEGEIENSVIFYSLGDFVEYSMILKYVDETKVKIKDISIASDDWLVYELDSDHAGEWLTENSEIPLKIKVTYKNENNTNHRHLDVSTLKITLEEEVGGSETEVVVNPVNGETTNGGEDVPAVPDTSGFFGLSTGASLSITLAVVGGIVVAVIFKRNKKAAASIIVPVLALTAVGTAKAEGITTTTTDFEIPIAGMINLKDKLAITLTAADDPTFQHIIFRQLGEVLGYITNEVQFPEDNPARPGYYIYHADYIDQELTTEYGYQEPLNDSMTLYVRYTPKFAMFNPGRAEMDWELGPNGYATGRQIFYLYSRITDKIEKSTDWGLKKGVKVANAFLHATEKPSDEVLAGAVDISQNGNTQEKIWMWYDEEENNLYWWTIAPLVYAYDATALFTDLPAKKVDLTDIQFKDSISWRQDLTYKFGYMFANSAITEIVWGDDFDTSNGYTFEGMFMGTDFESLDLSHFDMTEADNVSKMFMNMKNLTDINLSSFGLEQAYMFDEMFSGDSSLVTLDLSAFRLGSYENEEEWVFPPFGNSEPSFIDMFKNCSNLETIYASEDFIHPEWDFDDERYHGGIENTDLEDMRVFTGATKLTGGAGTQYTAIRPANGRWYSDPDCYDYCESYFEPANEYKFLYIDGGSSKPGLFTRKEN